MRPEESQFLKRSRFDGDVVAITGGCGTVGLVTARFLRELGAEVCLLDLKAPAGSEEFRFVHCDVSDRSSVDRAAEAVGDVRYLVNAHGLQIRKSFDACAEEDWARVMDVNVSGTFRTCQSFAAGLKRLQGAVVNIGSVNGTVAARTGAAYGISKAAIAHLTRVLALEWSPTVRVNAVAPIAIPSGMTADLFADPQYVASRSGAIPLKRMAAAEDVAAATAYLLSANASMVTGHVLMVDGGFSIQ
jgi:NAD(P)-dependent dehydrogenase (short-subunit alcohol dehydrogenase family)